MVFAAASSEVCSALAAAGSCFCEAFLASGVPPSSFDCEALFALSIAAQAQKEGGVVAFIDAEHALDPSWAEKIGVSLNDLLVSQPNYGEQALDICDLLVRSNSVDVVVVDSVAALTPKAELDGEMEDSSVGVQARMMSKAMRKLTAAVSQ